MQSTSRSTLKGSAASSIFQQAGFAKLLRLVYDTAALRGSARLRPATSSPMNLMPTSEARPILRRLHQTLPHGILADVLPLLRATPAVTQTMMKAAGLKSSGVRMRFGEAVHRETRPALNGEFQIARRAEQMQMIRHQQAIAHQPGGGRVPPEVMERALNGCLGGPAFAFLRADGEENPIRSAGRKVNAFCRCAAIGRAAVPRRHAHQNRFRVGYEAIRNGNLICDKDFCFVAGRRCCAAWRRGTSALPMLKEGNKKAPDCSGAL